MNSKAPGMSRGLLLDWSNHSSLAVLLFVFEGGADYRTPFSWTSSNRNQSESAVLISGTTPFS